MNYNRPELLDRLAAEYVLGTLQGRARRRFERVQRSVPAAQAAVRAWNDRMAGLATPVEPVAPPARVWHAISARTQPARATRKASWWQGWWRPALGFAFGVLMTTGIVLLAPNAFVSIDELAQRNQALPQSYVGLLVDGDNVPRLLVSSTRHGTRVTVKSLRPIDVPASKVLQVWALPRDKDGKELPPFPIGVAQPTKPPGSTTFEMSDTSEKLLSNVTRLAVSLEDAPRSKGDQPGAFVLSGHCVKLW